MNLLKRIKELKLRNIIAVFGLILIVVGVVLIIPKAFAASVAVKSITITSQKLDYNKKVPGSYNIEKSASWIEKGKARITFDVDTIMKLNSKFTDIIFVLDVSVSMDGSKLDRVKSDSIDLINTLLSDSNNRGALVTFETTSKIVLPLTNNKDELVNAINSLTTSGCTNYYQALVNVDEILKEYKKEKDRECIVLFLTDGYPNKDVPNEEGQYQYLKREYPYLTINGIQYEMGTEILNPIKKVSDQQFIADMTNLNNVLFEASIAPLTYNEFLITDYINNDYFEIDGVDNIIASVGTTKLEYENDVPKVIWNIENLRSGSQAKLTIDVNLKKEYLNKGGLYPTNKKEEVKSEINKIKEDITSTNTPVLADNYKVIYEGNAPSGCTVQNVPATSNKSVFETVEISSSVPVCEGYQFKGWSIATKNVTKVNEDYFIMPEADVVIRASWSKMSVAKNIDGEVFTVQTLYKIIERQASLDNTKSEFVTSTSGIDFSKSPSDTNGKGVYTIADTKDYEYPVHYFRGEVFNNNVKFANFCWKIVRTTETGGVKLIYNGLPDDDGGCTNTTGEATQIGTSAFNSSSSSPADVGYMYGTRYTYSLKLAGSTYWYQYAGKSRIQKSSMGTTEYYYGDSVTYDEVTNTYTLNNITKYLWSSNYSSLKGKYTCFKDTEDGCETVSYIDSTGSSYAYYFNMVSGETYESLIEKANNYKWIYGNDVEYVDGKYVLKNTAEYSPMNFINDYQTGFNAHRYTCFTNSDSCTNVSYLYYDNYYMTLTEGKKIDDILKEMTTESSNTTNSDIKTTIDDWYSKNMADYTDRLEDTVWCNDRSIYQKGSWDKDSTTNGYLYFNGMGRRYAESYNPSIECPNNNNKFTVSSEKGNGKLTYPVALLTADEATLAGHGWSGYSKTSYLYTNQAWWVLSPGYFINSAASEFYVNSGGYLYHSHVNGTCGVRPSVSLAPGTMIIDGNGTANYPYEILMEN